MILQTGGSEVGDTSTRSRPNSSADARALWRGMTPNWLPSGSMTLTSLALISLFILILSLSCFGLTICHLRIRVHHEHHRQISPDVIFLLNTGCFCVYNRKDVVYIDFSLYNTVFPKIKKK